MKKKEKRYHKKVGNKAVSLYIQEVYLPKKTYTYKTDVIETSYYEFIGACVSNSRRTNNDWWNGDKKCNKMYNRSTGNSGTFITIAAMMTAHISTFIKEYGWYCCMIDGTDDHRMETYIKMACHYAKKNNISLTTVATDDGLLCWFE